MKNIITYGTFDLLHYGHVELLYRASELGTKLIVGLSTDKFNEEKNKFCEIEYWRRKRLVEAFRFVDLVIPEETWEQKISDVLKYQIDVFVMGDDWEGKFDFLKEYCEVKYLRRTKLISTTALKSVLNLGK
ncbi:glycerol-3-phosphate cytidylyltransferase [Segetibacter aerophilus]|uniref:Glycerol-3-phosphate cytidylyltransferase n=1 Tax=Segetibacter aerophilus TaxID=670293 RepID=A0A512BH86_9BACT|nr:glycerol-3-phosphate cytidylyltransferase [Segetibacter aerophilus]GEO11235.1 glycerol-3-phosphate cytidylyltransferase [Segetibacter aerophilus]